MILIKNLTKYIFGVSFILCSGCSASEIENQADYSLEKSISEFLEDKKIFVREDKKRNQRIYTFYTDRSYVEVLADLESRLGKDWFKKEGVVIQDKVTTGMDIFFSEKKNNIVVSIGQTTTSDLNMTYKYIVTLIVGDNLDN